MLNRLLFWVTVVVIVTLTLLNSTSLAEVYLFCAQVLPVDPVWIKKHAPQISSFGHFLSCFTLTCLGFSVFREHFLKCMFCTCGLAIFCEFMQNFSSTRQANVEDIAFSLAGTLLALSVIIFIRARRAESLS